LTGLIIDSFAGGGGASTGIEWALGRSPDYAINHDREALAMHAANHPGTVHLEENVWKVDPDAVTKGRPVFLLWASPDCRHHSKAKGGAPVSRSVRGLADVVILWARRARPQVILLENVEEFQDWGPLTEEGKPCQARKGSEFARWVRALEAEGYAVQWAQSRACNKGAPTIRKRLYLCARRDGKPIIIPPVTHGDPKKDAEAIAAGALQPWRTAAGIIDWSLPCPSIFLTKADSKAQGLNIIRPLAAKTMSRIARGFKRYVLDRPEPFIVAIAHGDSGGRRSFGIDEPHRTVSTSGTEHVVIAPMIGVNRHESIGQPADRPLPTITANSFIKRPGAGGPLSAIAATLAPFVSYAQQGGVSRAADEPHHTVCANAKDQNQIVTGMLVPRYGERAGQEPRSRDITQPMPTIVPTGNGGDLAAVYLAQHNGNGVIGRDAGEPLSTVTTSAANQQPVLAYLTARQNNTARGALDEPAGTVLAAGNHHAVTLPHLSAYYGSSDEPGSAMDEPARTATGKARFGHVEAAGALPPLTTEQIARAREVAAFLRAEGVWDGREADGSPAEFVTVGPWMVWDIGMRMLTPRELARAQGFPDSYILAAPSEGKPLTETAQRHKIGNSVSPYEAASWVWWNCVHALTLPDVPRRRAALPPLPPEPDQQMHLIAAE
jgi:DNA (cytosine-5)-methyltransferase 1